MGQDFYLLRLCNSLGSNLGATATLGSDSWFWILVGLGFGIYLAWYYVNRHHG